MKDQYLGDLNDHRKSGLVRRLGGPDGLSLAIAGMLAGMLAAMASTSPASTHRTLSAVQPGALRGIETPSTSEAFRLAYHRECLLG